MIGASYLGWVQWWAAREAPPHLVTLIPNVSPPDPYFNIPYEYGAFFLFGAIWWADILEEEATADLSGKAFKDIVDKKYAKILRKLPVVDLDETVLGKQNAYWREWIAHPNNDAYWDRANFLASLDKVDIPVYRQSGWYDGDGIGSKLNYLAMAKYGHKNQKLVLGPWPHTASATRMGPRTTDFGPNAIIDLERSYVRWLDRWLKGMDNGIDQEPLVALFVMGSNKWLVGDTYPLPGTQFTKFYLASQGKANTSSGDGRLVSVAPAGAGADIGAAFDTYTYDPADPTPDPGFYFDPSELVEDDQAKGEETSSKPEVSVEEQQADALAYYGKVDGERQDILVYETPVVTEALTFAGPISAVLYASSSAKDTDWFMRLSQVDVAGGVFPLVHGVIRARYRNSFSAPELLNLGEICEYHLDMWQTGITVPAGARLRVEVASASFPLFSRNLNTGGHNETETDFVSAVQQIYHDKDHPSHIVLPVIREPAIKDTVE
jgi:predicted acyl esterase